MLSADIALKATMAWLCVWAASISAPSWCRSEFVPRCARTSVAVSTADATADAVVAVANAVRTRFTYTYRHGCRRGTAPARPLALASPFAAKANVVLTGPIRANRLGDGPE